MIDQYMENGYYPHVKAGWKARVRVAWRILWHGDTFPQPEPWYIPLHRLVTSPFGLCVRDAVRKAEREFGHDKTTTTLRLHEAKEWAITYLKEKHLYSAGMHTGTINFLIEWYNIHDGQHI